MEAAAKSVPVGEGCLSLCDNCFSPGACCKGFTFPDKTFWFDDNELSVYECLAKEDSSGRLLPFVLLRRGDDSWIDEDTGRPYGHYHFWCPLLKNGRCGDYQNRPAVCRNYEPASCGLCVHFNGAESGEAVNSLLLDAA